MSTIPKDTTIHATDFISSQNNLGILTDGDLTIVDSVKELNNLSLGVKMDGYVIAMLTKGSASFFIDGEAHEMHHNQLFVFRPHITLARTMISADAEYYILVISPQYSEKLVAISGLSGWNIMLFLSANPIIDLPEDVTASFVEYHKLLRKKMSQTVHNRRYREIIGALSGAMMFEFHDFVEDLFKIKEQKFSSTELIFRRFYEILNNTTPKYHKVEYYAKQLNITPKYFSSICKRLTGQTALQHITTAVLKDIAMLLRDERLSIKEIAERIGFPNQSFLGSYVRKHLGVSPQKYREQLRRHDKE